MYAVIKAGGKQQKVQKGDVIEVELTHATDGKVELHPILVVDDDGKTHYGKEAQKAVVVAKLVGEQKGDKVKVFKYRPKTGYAKKQGHRQMMTLLEIEDIKMGTRAPAKAEKPAAEAEKPAAKSEKPAAKSEKPAAEAEKPAAKSEKPAAKSEKPAATEEPAEPPS